MSVALVGLFVFAVLVGGAWWTGVEPPGAWTDAASITGSVWVMSYGVPLRLMGVDYSLIPWGFAALPLWLSHQAGRWLVGVVRPRRWRSVASTWILAVLVGAALVTAVSVVADTPEVQTSARRALAMALLIGAVGVGSGMWRASDLVRAAFARVPAFVRVIIRASVVGFVAAVGLASAALALATVASFQQISLVFAALQPTMFDAVALVVLSVGYLPTLVGWALAYVAGAGVSWGPDVIVSPFVAAVPPTPLPAFPPLAAIPEATGPLTWALPALTVFAGALIGLSVSRWAAREGPLIRIVIALLATALAALWVMAFLWFGSGSLGDGRLSSIGPDPGLAALLAGTGFAVGALPTSILRARRRPRRLRAVPVSTGPVAPEPASSSAKPSA